jgi:hypothetical protein
MNDLVFKRCAEFLPFLHVNLIFVFYASPPHFAASLGRKYFPKTIVVHKVSVEKQVDSVYNEAGKPSIPLPPVKPSNRSATNSLKIWWFKPTKLGINAPQPVPSPVIFLGYYHTWRKNWDLKMTIINHHLGKMT